MTTHKRKLTIMPQTNNQEEKTEDGSEQPTDEQIDVAAEELVEILFEKWGERAQSR